MWSCGLATSEGRPTEVEFRASAFGRSTHYTLSYDYSDAPAVLSWSMLRGDIMRTIDGAYHFSPTTDGGTEVRYDLIIDLVVPLPGLRQAPRRGADPQHRARAEGPRRVVSRRRIGIDVGGTKCLGVVLDESGEVIEEQRRPTPPGTEAFVDTLAELAGALGVTDSLGHRCARAWSRARE